MIKNIYKYPRLYIKNNIKEELYISLNIEQSHYLNNVVRKKQGDILRLFNGKDGEWVAEISSLSKKKCDVRITKQIKKQPINPRKIKLFFSPIKKKRLDILIEKSVELGVSDLYPIITNRCENRKINIDRTLLQIIEAAEQCERLDMPTLHPIQNLENILSKTWELPLNICLERNNRSKPISSYSYDKGASFVIGSEGGFDNLETEMVLNTKNINIIDLGENILRAETAAISCLSYAKLSLL